eukprot:RCo052714
MLVCEKKKPSIVEDITFEVFVARTCHCEWLCMFDRVESYLRSVLKMIPQPHHVTVRLSDRSNVLTSNLLEFLCCDLWVQAQVMEPAYVCVVSSDLYLRKDLITQMCVFQRELHWPAIAMDFKSSPWDAAFLCAILTTYYQPLKILAVIPPSVLFSVFENIPASPVLKVVFSRISTANEKALQLLHEAQGDAFVSALKWALLHGSGLPSHQRDLVVLTAGDVQNLVHHHIRLGIGQQSTNLASAFSVLRLLFPLLGPTDLLVNEPGIRDYLLSRTEAQTCELMADPALLFGVVVFDFLLHVTTRSGIFQSLTFQGESNAQNGAFINHHNLVCFVEWLEHRPEALNEVEVNFLRRLKPDVFSFLLCKSTSCKQTKELAHLALRFLEGTRREHSAVVPILKEALKRGCEHTQVLVFAFPFLGKVPVRLNDDFVDAALETCETSDFSPLVRLSQTSVGLLQPLPLEVIDNSLFNAYLRYFECSAGGRVHDDVVFHVKMLTPSVAARVLAESRHGTSDRGDALLFTAWALNPAQPLPWVPSKKQCKLLLQVIENSDVRFRERVAANQAVVSPLALYLTFPWYLDLGTLNSFNRLFDRPVLNEECVILCQKPRDDANIKYPTARLRVSPRTLPASVLAGMCEYEPQYNPKAVARDDRLRFDVVSGISPATISRNLQSLVDLKLKNFGAGSTADTTPEYLKELELGRDRTRVCLAFVLFGWFCSFGLHPEHPCFQQWISQLEDSAKEKGVAIGNDTFKKRIAFLWDELHRFDQEERLYGVCLHPLPTFYDVRVQQERYCYRLFGATVEEARYTLQLFD